MPLPEAAIYETAIIYSRTFLKLSIYLDQCPDLQFLLPTIIHKKVIQNNFIIAKRLILDGSFYCITEPSLPCLAPVQNPYLRFHVPEKKFQNCFDEDQVEHTN